VTSSMSRGVGWCAKTQRSTHDNSARTTDDLDAVGWCAKTERSCEQGIRLAPPPHPSLARLTMHGRLTNGPITTGEKHTTFSRRPRNTRVAAKLRSRHDRPPAAAKARSHGCEPPAAATGRVRGTMRLRYVRPQRPTYGAQTWPTAAAMRPICLVLARFWAGGGELINRTLEDIRITVHQSKPAMLNLEF